MILHDYTTGVLESRSKDWCLRIQMADLNTFKALSMKYLCDLFILKHLEQGFILIRLVIENSFPFQVQMQCERMGKLRHKRHRNSFFVCSVMKATCYCLKRKR